MNIHDSVRLNDDLLWFGNTLVAIRLASRAGADGISVVEHWMPHGEAPPLHIHQREDEVFHILEGVIRFRVGDGELVGQAGQTLLAPKGVPHAFRVESTAGARCLTITQGADFETMVRQTSRAAAYADLPEAVAPTPELIEKLSSACAANNIDIIGAPIG